MSWDRIEGQWKQRRGKAMRHWGTMMNDNLASVAGKYEELVGKLQEQYGIATQENKSQVDEFRKTIIELKKANSTLDQLQKSLNAKETMIKTGHHTGKQGKKSVRPRSGR